MLAIVLFDVELCVLIKWWESRELRRSSERDDRNGYGCAMDVPHHLK